MMVELSKVTNKITPVFCFSKILFVLMTVMSTYCSLGIGPFSKHLVTSLIHSTIIEIGADISNSILQMEKLKYKEIKKFTQSYVVSVKGDVWTYKQPNSWSPCYIALEWSEEMEKMKNLTIQDLLGEDVLKNWSGH